ncbi:MAG: c-type cytochrome [Planctomycetaceae bacterium]|jgi:putative membrane-bound dehydrogenase-like protein|nr:c-type cytochrome [Planctomycetaceae bacterium]MBT6154503.1 c-type cytochrome [Planctomycetaceae bacterium]MBT6486533.1 c-type cytochrome [Planctomycetaceae bacterium]MBT6497960.1 c-type cytochrome [Planctomycetaceae bacterium]
MKQFRFGVLACSLLLLVLSDAFAQRILIPRRHDKPPGPALSPAEAVKKMTVPPGFSVEVVAAEPDVINPVAMTIDERGRFWICESIEYPRRSPGKGRDRVKVLEDVDGDGKAEKVSIFADGLNIPSGIAVGHGGVWVANAPDILFLQDTDGDGKADKRRVVVTGFGRTDTHELPNSLTWGPDGWLYGLNGVFNYSHVKYPPGSPHAKKNPNGFKFTCALFRIHPRTWEFQIFAAGTSNPWGIAWDNEGSAFISACVIDHLWHLTETGYYHRQGGPYPPHTWKLGSIVKHKHQKAAYCGITFFDSDAYPAEYREKLYMGNIHGGCLNVDVLQRDGATYFAKPRPDFLTANDAWFMPVVQKTGPDGCLYVLDWYDRYHCYQDANADPKGIDRLRGRLYRIRYKNTPRVAGFDLSKESDAELIARLHSPNVYFRENAQRLLSERSSESSQPLLERLVLNDKASRKARMHAFWALLGMSRPLSSAFFEKAVAHSDPSFRAWAIRGGYGNLANPLALSAALDGTSDDPSSDVQLQRAITASKLLTGKARMTRLLEILKRHADDKLIPHVAWQNIEPLLEEDAEDFLDVIADLDAQPAVISSGMLPLLAERILARHDPNSAAIVTLLAMLTDEQTGDATGARQFLGAVARRVQNREIAGDRLASLKAAVAPTIKQILDSGADGPLYFDTALLAISLKDMAGIPAIRKVLSSTAAPETQRVSALNALVAAGDESLLESVEGIFSDRKRNSPALRAQVLASLGKLRQPQVADVVLSHYKTLEPELQPRAVELLTQRVAWSKRLLAAIGKKEIPANALNLNQVRRLLATGDKQLAGQVAKTWGTIRDTRNPQREKLITQMKQHIRGNPGDPFAGQKVFKKVCGQCHKLYGEGFEVGPDITLNGRNSFDQLLSNVFDPSLVIGAAYRANTVVTTGGRVLTGLVVENSQQRVILKTQGGKLETIPRGEIEVFKASKISMMPEELEKQIKPKEMVDLFAFLVLDRPPSDSDARQLPGVREIKPRSTTNPKEFADILSEIAPGFTTSAVGEGGLRLLKEHSGRAAVVQTHPVNREKACVLRGTFELPAGKKSLLALSVSHHPQGDWRLIARVNGKPLLDSIVGVKTTKNGWAELTVDLSSFAGKKVTIELHNHPNNWANEFGYWGRAAVISE